MSIRARSASGAVLLAAGLLGMLGAAVFNRPVILGISAAAVAAGLLLVLLAVRAVARQIRDVHAVYEARLRAELPPLKKDPPPPP